MLHVDIPTKSEFSRLAERRADPCVSICLNTTPVTQDVQASRIEMKNFIREAQTARERGVRQAASCSPAGTARRNPR